MTIKVLHLISGPNVGGAERNLLNLIRYMAPSHIEHHVAFRYFSGELRDDFESCGARLHVLESGRYRGYDPRRIKEISELKSLIAAQHIDILHAHLPPSILTGPIVAYLGGCKSVISVHAMRKQLGFHEFGQFHLVKRFIDAYIEGSLGVYNDLMRAGVPPALLHHIAYGVDGSLFSTGRRGLRREFRAAYAIPDDAFVIGRIARFDRQKGFDLLLRAVPGLLERIPELYVVLIGDGPEMETLKALAHSLGVAARVVFTGFFTDTHKALAGMDLVTITSRQEALGISTLEAMAAAKALVSFDIGGLGEAITHGENGILVKSEDMSALTEAIVRLYTDSSLREQMENESERRFRAGYSVVKMCECMQVFYANVASHQ